MIVDKASPDDVPSILEILYSRPGHNPTTWRPIDGATWIVARDAQGVCAFLAVRIDLDANEIIADQLEGEYIDGRPTLRGRRGLKVLGDFLRAKARSLGCIIYSVVAADNVRHHRALERRGFRLSSVVYAWSPEDVCHSYPSPPPSSEALQVGC